MHWRVNNFYNANHAPRPIVSGDTSRNIVRLRGKSGESLPLNASASIDPDGDKMSFHWSRYFEPGTFRGEIELKHADQAEAELKVPQVTQSRTIHLVLEVTDHGLPELTSFRRIVVELLPDR